MPAKKARFSSQAEVLADASAPLAGGCCGDQVLESLLPLEIGARRLGLQRKK